MCATRSSGFADVNGARLYYEVAGEGHPLVLIHAGIADSRMWDEQIDLFAQQYRVIRYDVRGFGNSPMPDGAFSRHQDLHDLLRFLGVDRAYLLGLSMGGEIAVSFALAYPEMTAALIAVAAGMSGYNWPDDMRTYWDAEEEALAQGDLARAVELNLRVWVDGPARTPDQVDPAVRERVAAMLLHSFKLPAGEASALPAEPTTPARLAEIRVPALVVVGDQDVPDMLTIADLLASNIPGARKVVVSGVAHMVNMERPDEFNRIVLDFLREL